LGRDSIGERGGANLYGFCGNNAINRWDVLGNSWSVVQNTHGAYAATATDAWGNVGTWNFGSRADAERWGHAWVAHDMSVVGDRAVTTSYLNPTTSNAPTPAIPRGIDRTYNPSYITDTRRNGFLIYKNNGVAASTERYLDGDTIYNIVTPAGGGRTHMDNWGSVHGDEDYDDGGYDHFGAMAGTAALLGWANSALGSSPSYTSSGGSSASTSSGGGLLTLVLDALGKVWALPNTAIGFAGGVTGWMLGGNAPSIGNNAIQFTNNPLAFAGAITLGNAIIYGPNFGPTHPLPNGTVGDHERQHTYQAQVLGVLYLPSNILGLGAGFILNGDTHGPANWNETGPQATPPHPWPWP
jgi:hypothetical protein